MFGKNKILLARGFKPATTDLVENRQNAPDHRKKETMYLSHAMTKPT
jgi:hypothetical protein